MELPSATPSSPSYLLSYRLRGRRGGTDGREVERRRWSWPLSHRGLCFPYVSLWLSRSRATRASGGKERGVGGVLRQCRARARRGRAPRQPWGPPPGCKDDRRGGGGGRALSGTCRSPRYGAARALAPCLYATKVAAGVWLAGPSPRCRAAR